MSINLASVSRASATGLTFVVLATIAPDRSDAGDPTPSFCQGATFTPDVNDSKCKLSTGMAFLPCVTGTPMYPGGAGYAYDLQDPRPCGVRRCGIIFTVRCGQNTGTIHCIGS